MIARHKKMLRQAVDLLVAVADDSGESLVDVIAEAERVIVEETKVGDACVEGVGPGRRGYTLIDGRLHEVTPPP